MKREWHQIRVRSVSLGDGSIDETEFSKVCSSHGIEEAEAREAFKKLEVVSINQAKKKDNDKKNLMTLQRYRISRNCLLSPQGKEVTREKFADLWKQYFCSDDPNVPGNFIFGKTSF